MNFFDTILLGLLQGITEFLPVSSSGHLAIAQYLLKFEQPGLLFDTLLHCATLIAVVIFFHRKIGLIIKAFFGIFMKRYRLIYIANRRFLWGIIGATIPTGIIGLFLEQYIETYFHVITLVGYALIVTSILLFVSDKFNGRDNVSFPKSVFLGIVQGIAVIPGISRSGSTIAAAVILGIKREEAAEFSFLMSIPAILGATILQVKHIDALSVSDIAPYAAGMIAAFISGLIAIRFMMYIVTRARLKIFAIYCLVLGICTVIFI